MLAVADESFFSSSRMAVLTNGLLSFKFAAAHVGDNGDASIVFFCNVTAT